MKKLTSDTATALLARLKENASYVQPTIHEGYMMQALEIALPVLEEKPVGWLEEMQALQDSLDAKHRSFVAQRNRAAVAEAKLTVLKQQEEATKQLECPFPCGWKELLRISMSDGAFLARYLIEGEEVKDIHRHAAFNNTDRLVRVLTAILNTQEKVLPVLEQQDKGDLVRAAFTGSGSLEAIKRGDEGYIWGSRADSHPIELFVHRKDAVCFKCGGTGEADSGATQPWGEAIMVECDCQFEQQERERGEEA